MRILTTSSFLVTNDNKIKLKNFKFAVRYNSKHDLPFRRYFKVLKNLFKTTFVERNQKSKEIKQNHQRKNDQYFLPPEAVCLFFLSYENLFIVLFRLIYANNCHNILLISSYNPSGC